MELLHQMNLEHARAPEVKTNMRLGPVLWNSWIKVIPKAAGNTHLAHGRECTESMSEIINPKDLVWREEGS